MNAVKAAGGKVRVVYAQDRKLGLKLLASQAWFAADAKGQISAFLLKDDAARFAQDNHAQVLDFAAARGFASTPVGELAERSHVSKPTVVRFCRSVGYDGLTDFKRKLAGTVNEGVPFVHRAVDVQALDCDFYVWTGHKLYGPTGIGVLYGKAAQLEALPPFNGGGEMIRDVTLDTVTYNTPPHRFEAGTPPIAQAVGLGAALDYIEGLGRERIAAHEAAISAYAHERLSKINALRIFGTAPGKGPILSFAIEGAHAHDIATVIDRSGVAVRAGTHCAMPLMQRYGVTSTCRASFALYNTLEEVDVLADALERARKLFA